MLKYFLEVRNRLILILISCLSIAVTSYYYKEMLVFLLVYLNKFINSGNNPMFFYFIFTNAVEILRTYFEVIQFLGFQVFILFFIYHFFIFLSPAFFKTEFLRFWFWVKIVLVFWLILFVLSIYLIIPLTWDFFLSFQNLLVSQLFNLHFEAKLQDYVSFYISFYYMLMFYFYFFVLFVLVLDYIKMCLKVVKKFRKFYHYCFIVFSALVSPPDVFVQIFISLIFVVLYEALVFFFVFKAYLINWLID